MIKKIWNAIHFGRFKSQWRNDLPETLQGQRTLLGKTLLYENHLEKTDDGYQLVTENGGYIGRYAFYVALPIYLALIIGLFTGAVHPVHIVMIELGFISVFGLMNGWSLHRLMKDPGFGVEELSLHRIKTS